MHSVERDPRRTPGRPDRLDLDHLQGVNDGKARCSFVSMGTPQLPGFFVSGVRYFDSGISSGGRWRRLNPQPIEGSPDRQKTAISAVVSHDGELMAMLGQVPVRAGGEHRPAGS